MSDIVGPLGLYVSQMAIDYIVVLASVLLAGTAGGIIAALTWEIIRRLRND